MSSPTPEQATLWSRGFLVLGDARTQAGWPPVTDMTQEGVCSLGGRMNRVAPKRSFDSKILFLEHTVQSKGLNSQCIRNTTEEDRSSQGWVGKKLSQAVPNSAKTHCKKKNYGQPKSCFTHRMPQISDRVLIFFPHKLIPFPWIDRPFLLLYRHDL